MTGPKIYQQERLDEMSAGWDTEHQKELKKLEQKSSENARISKYEQNRVNQKQLLMDLVNEYTVTAKDDPMLMIILDYAELYSKAEATSSSGDLYEFEQEVYDIILKKLDNYADILKDQEKSFIEKYSHKAWEEMTPEEQEEYDKEAKLLDEKAAVRMTLGAFFGAQRDGLLTVPEPTEHTDGNYLDYSNWNGGSRVRLGINSDYSDKPLFPHEPNINDIRQGYFGDCYLISGLSAIVESNPGAIRDMLKDNGNGTCTVRFFSRSEKGEYTPFYITVNKQIPVGATIGRSARFCLWAQVIEKAYMLSGLHLSRDLASVQPVPKDVDMIYQNLLAEQKRGAKFTHKDFPWLVDKNGNLHEYSPHFHDIEGGHNGDFIECVLGKDGVNTKANYEGPYLYRRMTKKGKLQKAQGVMYLAGMAVTFNAIEEGRMRPHNAAEMTENLISGRIDPPVDNSTLDDLILAKALQDAGLTIANMSHIQDKYEDVVRKWLDIVKEEAGADYQPPTGNELRESDVDILRRAAGIFEGRLKDYERNPLEHKLASVFLEKAVKRYIDVLEDNLNLPQPYSGQYNKHAQKTFADITKALADGYPVSFGADGDNGVIIGNHAYSVVGTRTAEDGKKFVTVRNPWGETITSQGVAYKQQPDGTLKRMSVNAPDGIFELELGDFLQAAGPGELYINKPKAVIKAEMQQAKQLQNVVPQPAEELEVVAGPQVAEQPEVLEAEVDDDDPQDAEIAERKVPNRVAGAYYRALCSIEDSLNGTDYTFSSYFDSESFKDAKIAIRVAKAELLEAGGRDYELLYLKLGALAEICGEYCDHAKKAGLNARRKDRVDIINGISKLANMAKRGIEYPEREMQKELAKAIVEHSISAKQKDNPDVRLEVSPQEKASRTKRVLESFSFERVAKNLSFGQMQLSAGNHVGETLANVKAGTTVNLAEKALFERFPQKNPEMSGPNIGPVK